MCRLLGGGSIVPAIEPVPVEDDFIRGIHNIEACGPCVRFVLFNQQRLYDAGGADVRVIKRRLVMPREDVMPAIMSTLEFLRMSVGQTIGELLQHLH